MLWMWNKAKGAFAWTAGCLLAAWAWTRSRAAAFWWWLRKRYYLNFGVGKLSRWKQELPDRPLRSSKIVEKTTTRQEMKEHEAAMLAAYAAEMNGPMDPESVAKGTVMPAKGPIGRVVESWEKS